MLLVAWRLARLTGNRGRESHRLGLVRRSLLRTKRDRRASISIVQNRRDAGTSPSDAPPELLRELVAHLRQNRTQLREEWVGRIAETRLLTAMTKEEIFAEATSVYDSYVEALETETFEALQNYARNLSERIIPRGVETHEVVGIVLLLRDVLARSLFAKYQADFQKLNRILDSYEPAANRIANTVAVGFVQERERGNSAAAGGDSRTLHPGIASSRTPADSSDYRSYRSSTCKTIDGAIASWYSHYKSEGRCDRHHGRGRDGRDRCESHRTNGGSIPLARRHRDRHRALA